MSGIGCAKLSVEGGDKPIHIVMDINIKIDQKLDQFFAFEEQAPPPTPASVPTSVPASAPTSMPMTQAAMLPADESIGSTTNGGGVR
jgi:hypothetical protein